MSSFFKYVCISLRVAASVEEMSLQQTPKARLIVH